MLTAQRDAASPWARPKSVPVPLPHNLAHDTTARRGSPACGRAPGKPADDRRGDRPAYRVTTAQDGRWTVDAMPWVSVAAVNRREALDEARAAIAAWLEVEPDAFDVEIG